jgi:hypothetical protein
LRIYFDGTTPISVCLTNYNSADEMLNASIVYLMKRKYHQHKVFIHNFSNFDGIFLLKILSSLSNSIKPIIRDGEIIDLNFIFEKYYLHFRDSLLLLPSSLAKLARHFNY